MIKTHCKTGQLDHGTYLDGQELYKFEQNMDVAMITTMKLCLVINTIISVTIIMLISMIISMQLSMVRVWYLV